MSVSAPISVPVGSFTREAFAAHLERVKHLPAWWLDRKRAAYERFASLPMPKRTDEGWRFSNFSALTLDGFVPPTDKRQVTRAKAFASASLSFLNNSASGRDGSVPAGIIFDTLQNALLKHGDLVKAHLLTQPSKLGSGKFAALHEAFLEDGAFVYAPKGTELAQPLAVYHLADGDNTAVFPHTLVVAEENTKVTVTDFYGSVDPQARHQFAVGGNDLYAGHGAQ